MCVWSSNVLGLRLLGLVLVDVEPGFQLGEEAGEEGGQHWMDDVDRLCVGVLRMESSNWVGSVDNSCGIYSRQPG
jgi:hypothetical protein